VLDPALAARLARRALGVDEVRELPAPRPLTIAERGALELLATTLAEGRSLVAAAVLDEHEPLAPTAGADALLVLEAAVESPVGAGWARLVVPESLALAAPIAAGELAPDLRARLRDCACALRIEIGRTAIGRGDLASLHAGDVILFERFGVRDARGGPVTLRLGRGGFAARIDGDAITVVEPYRLGLGGAMEHEPVPPKAASEESGSEQLLRELPVEVVCELGRVTMTGRELLELRPGTVIPIGRPLSGPVDLSVGGRAVARGELVDIEGEIGVRLTQLLD
jgi:type III secretion system YscQ/HrcQ family protein